MAQEFTIEQAAKVAQAAPITLYGLLDRDWMTNALLAQSYQQSRLDLDASTYTDADVDFTDTQIGGQLCINPMPQFTRSADVRRRGRLGRYYQEALKTNYQIINVRLGVPAFNPLILFVTNFYNSEAGILARTGSGPGIAYTMGRVGSAVVSLMSWKIQAARIIGNAFSFFAGKGSSKFYTVKPTMPAYWNAVQTMANQIAVNTGIVPRVFGEEPNHNLKTGYEFNQSDIQKMIDSMPMLFHRSGTIDILAIAQRAQRMARQQLKLVNRMVDNGSSMSSVISELNKNRVTDPGMRNTDFRGYLDSWFATQTSGANTTVDKDDGEVASLEEIQKDDSMSDFLAAELDDGAAFVGLRVNPTTGVSDSFSNTVGESEFASTLNNLTSSGRNLRFTFANGKVGPIVDQITSTVTDFIQGAADGFGVGGIVAALTGGAFVDVPSMWKGSTTNLQGGSYTIPLVSPYNHRMAQYLFMDIPLCMILAMVMPISTGKQSYTSPFICEIYDKGRTQSRLAIVDSVNVTRGVNNLAFSRDQRAMGYEVQISFKYLDNLVHMPIAMGISLTETVARTIGSGLVGAASAAAEGVFDDDTLYTDYLATLSSLGLADQIYPMRKLKLNLTREMVRYDAMTSPTRMMSFFADSMVGRLASVFYAGTVRQ